MIYAIQISNGLYEDIIYILEVFELLCHCNIERIFRHFYNFHFIFSYIYIYIYIYMWGGVYFQLILILKNRFIFCAKTWIKKLLFLVVYFVFIDQSAFMQSFKHLFEISINNIWHPKKYSKDQNPKLAKNFFSSRLLNFFDQLNSLINHELFIKFWAYLNLINSEGICKTGVDL